MFYCNNNNSDFNINKYNRLQWVLKFKKETGGGGMMMMMMSDETEKNECTAAAVSKTFSSSSSSNAGNSSSGSISSSVYELAAFRIQSVWRFRLKFFTTRRLVSDYLKYIPSFEMVKLCRWFLLLWVWHSNNNNDEEMQHDDAIFYCVYYYYYYNHALFILAVVFLCFQV